MLAVSTSRRVDDKWACTYTPRCLFLHAHASGSVTVVMKWLSAGARNALPLGRVSLLLLIVLHLLVVFDRHDARNDLLAHLRLLDFLAILVNVVLHRLSDRLRRDPWLRNGGIQGWRE